MLTKNMKQKPTQIKISEYEEVFSIISILSNKYVYPNMPKMHTRYDYPNVPEWIIIWNLYEQIEIGTMYKRGDICTQTLYFAPRNSIFISDNTSTCMGIEFHNLEDILDFLDTPTQILTNFYCRLFKFSKERKKKLKGLSGALHFLKIILENEDEESTRR